MRFIDVKTWLNANYNFDFVLYPSHVNTVLIVSPILVFRPVKAAHFG